MSLKDNLELKQIHICIRHGDRSTAYPTSKNEEQTKLESELWKPHLLDNNTKERLNNLFHHNGYEFNKSFINSSFGKLTKTGLKQLIDFGSELNNKYVKTKFINLPISKGEIKCYCTCMERTLQSTQGILYGLFDLNDESKREEWFPDIKVLKDSPSPLNRIYII